MTELCEFEVKSKVLLCCVLIRAGARWRGSTILRSVLVKQLVLVGCINSHKSYSHCASKSSSNTYGGGNESGSDIGAVDGVLFVAAFSSRYRRRLNILRIVRVRVKESFHSQKTASLYG